MTTKVVLWLAVTAGALSAAPITYTISAVGSGTLDGSPFTNATITFTQVNDTANVFTNPNPLICGASVICAGDEFTNTVTVSGVGTDTLADATEFFVNSATAAAGISDDTRVFDLLDESNAAFSSYGLTTALGPLTGSVSAGTTGVADEPTGGGFLAITSYSGNATFQAVPGGSSVPEPGSLSLMLAAVLPLSVATRRRRLPQFFHHLKIAAGPLSLLCFMLPGSLWASGITQYNYTGAQYNVSSGCSGSYCSGGPYALVVTFDVAAGTPLTNLNNVDITADVTSFSFSDGSGFVITQADTTFSDQFIISTDANENITIWTLNACTTPPYFAPGSSAAGACMDTYWIPSYPQILDRTSWTDGSEDGQCFAYGQGVVQSSNCLGTFTTTLPGSSAPEPANLLLMGTGLFGLLAVVATRNRGR